MGKNKLSIILKSIGAVSISSVLVAGIVWAGSLNPSSAPVVTMKTLQNIYLRLTAGTAASDHTLSPLLDPAGTMYTLDEIYTAIPGQGSDVTGTNGQLVITIPNAIYSGSKTATASDTSLLDTNICSTATIFGVPGAATCGATQQSYPADQTLTDNTNGTISDDSTHLMWTKCSLNEAGGITDATGCTDTFGTFNWVTAGSSCGDLVSGGHDNWYLPTISELQTIVDYSVFNPAIYGPLTTFPNTQSDGYWSSTTGADNSGSAWIVYFFNGDVYVNDKAGYDYVRCVRQY